VAFMCQFSCSGSVHLYRLRCLKNCGEGGRSRRNEICNV